jgi:Sec-independent protein translocase protein TatA
MNDNSEMMKVLETIADRLVDIHLSNGRQFDELNRKLDALLAVEAGDQLPLFAVAAAAPASVVPNEDEAMPVAEPATSPRKKHRLPEPVRVLGQQFRDLHKLADAKAEERAKVLAASKGRETKESVELLVKEQDLRTEARKFQQDYDRDRRPFSSRKTAKATN